MTEAKSLAFYIQALEGITYPDWIKLKAGVNRSFDHEKKELEGKLQLKDVQLGHRLIQSQFGQM